MYKADGSLFLYDTCIAKVHCYRCKHKLHLHGASRCMPTKLLDKLTYMPAVIGHSTTITLSFCTLSSFGLRPFDQSQFYALGTSGHLLLI